MATFQAARRIPIAHLNPNLESIDNTYAQGVVTLVWPYSSSDKSLSLLLVESDFRLRRQHGQVRVSFHGSSARSLARHHVNSGDKLLLGLKGAVWTKPTATISTPGRSIDWELSYEDFLSLVIQRPGEEPCDVNIAQPSSSPDSSLALTSPDNLTTHEDSIVGSARKVQVGSSQSDIWASPAFLKQSNPFKSSYDPFTEDSAEFLESGREKRFKFGQGINQWRFAETTPSPEKEDHVIVDDTEPSLPVVSHENQAQELPTQTKTDSADTKGVINASDSDIPEAEGISEGLLSILGGEISEPIKENAGSVGSTASESPTQFLNDGLTLADNGPSQPNISNSPTSVSGRRLVSSQGSSLSGDKTDEAIFSGAEPIDFAQYQENPDFGLDGAASSRAANASQKEDFDRIEVSWKLLRGQATEPDVATEDHSPEALHAPAEDHSPEILDAPAEDHSPEVLHAPAEDHSPEILDAPAEDHSPKILDAPAEDHSPEVLHAPAEDYSPEALHAPAEERSLEALHILKEEDPWLDGSKSAQETVPPHSSHAKVAGNEHLQASESPVAREPSSEKDFDYLTHPLLSKSVHAQDHDIPDTVTPDRSESTQQVSKAERLPGQEEPSTPEYSVEHARSNSCPPEKTSPSPIEKDWQHETHVPDVAEKTVNAPARSRSRVEVIDIESDEEEANTQVSLEPLPQLVPDSLQIALGSDEPLKPTQPVPPIQDVVNDVKTDDHGSPNSSVGPTAEFEPQNFDIHDKHSSSNVQLTVETLPPSPSDGIKLAEPPNVSEASSWPMNSEERLLSPPVSLSVLPATIDDSVKQVEETEIPALYEDQMSNIDSQLSTVMSRSVEDEYEEMIPHLTQETSAGIFPPELSTEAKSLPSEDQNLEAQEPEPAQPDETVQNDLEKPQRETTDNGEESPREGDTNESRTFKHTPQETPLVRRLKQQRRLSRLQQQDQSGSPNTASPWFARPSRDHNRLQKTDERLETPEPSHSLRSLSSANVSPEVSLPKASAQTSTLQSSPPRTPTSSQYMPASQPATGFRTTLSYFVPLASLQHHYGTEVDVLAIVVAADTIIKAESGPKDYVLSLHIIDPSSLPQRGQKVKTLTTAQCFRPRKMSLPRAKPGDAILLRNFKVHSLSKHIALISTDASGWAVFTKDKEVQMRGPPVEFGPEERGFARAHWNWWDSLSKEEKESLLAAATPKDTSAGLAGRENPGTSRRRGIGFDLPPSSSAKKRRFSEHGENDTSISKSKSSKGTNHEDSPNLGNSTVAFVPEREVSETPSPPQTRLRSRQSKAAAASLSPAKRSRKSDVQNLAVHELRDGTRYADEGQELNEEEENVLSPDTQIQVHRLRDGRTYPDRR